MKTYSFLHILPLAGFYAIVTNTMAFEKTGTGFAVAPDMILTAYHVVESGELISVSFGETSYPATMTAFNKELDWALLKMSGKAPGTVSIGKSSKVTLGESVYSLGYPASDILGDEIKYAKGEIGALSGLGGSKEHFQISVPIQPGNSGGPLFDEYGRVIGIVVSTLNPGAFFTMTDGALPQNINYALKIDLVTNIPRSSTGSPDSSVSVEANQNAIGLVKAQVSRASIAIPKAKRTLPATPPSGKPQDAYERQLQEVKSHATALLAKLTEFSPETYCQTNGVICPIATEEEAHGACRYLDSVRLEIEHFLEESEMSLVNSPERKKYNPHHSYGLMRPESEVFRELPVVQEWQSARNRLANYFNSLMLKNGLAEPSSFWKISFTTEDFELFNNWENAYEIENAEVGVYGLQDAFFGTTYIQGIKTKTKGTSVALWCLLKPYKGFKSTSSGEKPVDWTGSVYEKEEIPRKQQELIQYVVRTFERKYHLLFSIYSVSNYE